MQRHEFIILTLTSTFIFKSFGIQFISGNTETNGLITLSKHPIKYLKLLFASINFEMTILSTLTSQFFNGLFAP